VGVVIILKTATNGRISYLSQKSLHKLSSVVIKRNLLQGVERKFMEKRTIAEAAIEILKEAKQPLTAAEITQAILDKGLYSFNTKDPKAMVRGAVERRSEGVDRKNSTEVKLFKKLPDNRYQLKA